MRIAFLKTLFELARKDTNITLITGDLGFSVFEDFAQALPNQFLNAGVAEQNMTGVAAGMALEGKLPFIYSIVPFVTMRNFEQIRNDICYQNANVKIVGVGAGFSYGIYGHTHFGLEDVGMFRTIPNLTIIAPGDPIETEFAVREAVKINGPVYIRLGKAGEPNLYQTKPQLRIGKGQIIQDGKDITLITSGILAYRGLEVTIMLEEKGISVRLISMHTIKPFDREIILESAKKTKAVFTLEEHTINGGLGSAVAEVLAENAIGIPFKRIAPIDHFNKKTGSQEYMRSINHLSKDELVIYIMQNSSVIPSEAQI